MKSIIDWFIKIVERRNNFEVSILKKHREFTGFIIIASLMLVLWVVVYITYVQFSIKTFLESSKQEGVLISE